ncbi:helix-turn-helix domain-containing protein [Streptomyces sp. NPDC088794]|uniref:helix-turn-helix domain-containing protein n=1 Tax=Streptomyces sp. NPDC088794 TaxID=3365902 RepID=UPI00380F77B4
MPSHPRRRDGRAPLPAPADRARLRRAWGLTEAQVAAAFGVTEVTVRSWETGRTTPTGLRRASYAAFLSGLAQALPPVPAPAVPPTARPARRTRRTRPVGTDIGVLPLPPVPPAPAGPAPRTAGLPVGPRPDPVSTGRLRRFRFATAAVGVWIAVGHLITTAPVPHL